MRCSFTIVLALLLSTGRDSAQAHAPLARAIQATATGVQIWMPSFGVIFHADDSTRSAYACSALLGLPLEEQKLTWLSGSDGSVWLASQAGLRNVSADGCSTFELGDAWTKRPLAALAKHPSRPSLLYAITTETPPALYRSEDDGKRWQLVSELTATPPITGMQIVADAQTRIYISRSTKDLGSVERSLDEGSSFQTVATTSAQDLTLQRVTTGASDTLWATATAPGSRETRLLSAEQGEFSELKRVRYFGGLALTQDGGTVWLADETGGLHRSEDRGQNFATLHAELAIGCLHFDEAAHALWACTPGLTDEPALSRSEDRGTTFSPGTAFGAVSRLVSCPAPSNVAESCAVAWNEWQADVRMLAASSPSSTAVASDAGIVAHDASPVRSDTASESKRDAASKLNSDDDLSEQPEHAAPARTQESGCDLGRTGSTKRGWLPLALWFAYAMARRRRSPAPELGA